MMQPDDERLPDSTDIVVLVDGAGEIVECLDARKGKLLNHEFVVQHSVPHKRLVLGFGCRDASLIPTEAEERESALAIIPVAPSGECLVFNMYDPPPASGFPFGIDENAYCEGFLMCEIQGRHGEVLDDRSLGAYKFEMITAFRRFDHVDPPGLIVTQQEKEDVCAMVSPFHHALDPILTMYDDTWKDHWAVGLSASHGHFVGVYKSDWSGVAPDVCASSGHDVGVHYYIVVRGGLAEATAEQLVWLAKSSPSKRDETWETRLASHMVLKATEMARHARATLLQRALDVMHVSRVGDTITTEWNVARPAIHRLDKDGSVDTRAAYYRQCASAAECRTGVVTTSETEEGLLWLHGPPTATRTIGGKTWSSTETANAMPVFRDMDALTETASLRPFGYEREWGTCSLKPLFTVR